MSSLYELKSPNSNGLLLNFGIILIGKTENPHRNDPIFIILGVEDDVEDDEVAAQLVQGLSSVKTFNQLLHLLKELRSFCAVLLGARLGLVQGLEDLSDAADLSHRVLGHGLLQPFPAFGVHLFELGILCAVAVS